MNHSSVPVADCLPIVKIFLKKLTALHAIVCEGVWHLCRLELLASSGTLPPLPMMWHFHALFVGAKVAVMCIVHVEAVQDCRVSRLMW